MPHTLQNLGLVVQQNRHLAVIAESLSHFTYDDLLEKVNATQSQIHMSRERFETALTEVLSSMITLGVLDEELTLTESYRD